MNEKNHFVSYEKKLSVIYLITHVKISCMQLTPIMFNCKQTVYFLCISPGNAKLSKLVASNHVINSSNQWSYNAAFCLKYTLCGEKYLELNNLIKLNFNKKSTVAQNVMHTLKYPYVAATTE